MSRRIGGLLVCLSAFLLSFLFSTTNWAQVNDNSCAEQLADVVIMLDRSETIDRKKELPFEAQAAKRLLDTFITLNRPHQVAVGAFAKTAVILRGGNLTTNYVALKGVIDSELDVALKGSNLEDAIQVGEEELNNGQNPLKFLVIISDGRVSVGNTNGLSPRDAALQAAASARSRGIRIITIAYDSGDGSPTAIAGRQVLAGMASSGSVDNTVGQISPEECAQENGDEDDFYVAPHPEHLDGIFDHISDAISCDDNDACTEDVCDEVTRECSFTIVDFDHDDTPDCRDNCPNDDAKTDAGQCGCGVADTDTDQDGVADCHDQCVEDAEKIIPGVCGCGMSDQDSDGDGVADCQDQCPAGADLDSDGDGSLDCEDQCPNDADKALPGQCGCGVADVDTDEDGVADCVDQCANDPSKTAPGFCGCNVADIDTDGDGTENCCDQCPDDARKIWPGMCGCGVADVDSDHDWAFDCTDKCINDPFKTLPGQCGCGVQDHDRDADGTADCNDACPRDPSKVEAGVCGCGVADVDSDADGTLDCAETCPEDPHKVEPGVCGCGVPETEVFAAEDDQCPLDLLKTEPGLCGCGIPDADSDGDGLADCVDQCPQDSANDSDASGVCDGIEARLALEAQLEAELEAGNSADSASSVDTQAHRRECEDTEAGCQDVTLNASPNGDDTDLTGGSSGSSGGCQFVPMTEATQRGLALFTLLFATALLSLWEGKKSSKLVGGFSFPSSFLQK